MHLTFFSLPLFIFFHSEFGVIYYINLACTTLLLSKISLTLYHTFPLYHTFYIMFFNVPHILIPLLYYVCTSILHVFCILYLIFGSKFKVSFLTYLFHTSNIYTLHSEYLTQSSTVSIIMCIINLFFLVSILNLRWSIFICFTAWQTLQLV